MATTVISRVIGDSFADIFAPLPATDIPFLLLHKTDVSFVLSPLLPPSPERGEGSNGRSPPPSPSQLPVTKGAKRMEEEEEETPLNALAEEEDEG